MNFWAYFVHDGDFNGVFAMIIAIIAEIISRIPPADSNFKKSLNDFVGSLSIFSTLLLSTFQFINQIIKSKFLCVFKYEILYLS